MIKKFSVILIVLMLGVVIINGAKIKYHAKQIISLVDEDLGLVKQYPAYKVPDLSKLHQNISRDWIFQLWSNFFNPRSQWTTWNAIYRHGIEVMGFSHEQMIEIGEALGFLENEEPPKLVIKDNILYYYNGGKRPTKLLGASPAQLLHVAKGFAPPIPWEYEQYIEAFKTSGINFVRVMAVEDYDFTYQFCKLMEENGIVVQATMANGDSQHFGDYRIHIRNLKGLNNIIIECWNELCRSEFTQTDINEALEIANYALSEGMIVSGGAWGNCQSGKAMSDEFRKHFKGQIFVVHRPYPPLLNLLNYYNIIKEAGFPIVVWNEVLTKPYPTGIRIDEIEQYSRAVINEGMVGVNIYLGCENWFELMGKLCWEYNHE